jgi:hypothetical protein
MTLIKKYNIKRQISVLNKKIKDTQFFINYNGVCRPSIIRPSGDLIGKVIYFFKKFLSTTKKRY